MNYLKLLLLFIGINTQCILGDTYKELLTIKQLPTGHIYNSFQFKTITNSTFIENGY